MTPQPTQPMDAPRDPHLPPPAVVDWLLEQDWSEMIPVTLIQYHGSLPHGMSQSKLHEYQLAFCEIGADTGGRVSLPIEALDALRKDQSIRQAAFEQKRQACEADELARKANRGQQRTCEVEAVKVVWPLPFSHEWPWNRPGWSDDQGRCWLCFYPDDGWHVPTWKLARPSDYDLAAAIRGECVLTLPHDSLPLPVPQIKVSPDGPLLQ